MNRAPLSQTAEDYLKEIYKLQVEQGKATTSALAERVGVSAPSTTAMLKKLAALGLVEHEPYRGVLLTRAGEKAAIEVIRHHRLLEQYLSETLGLPIDELHAEADRLEHVLSEELEARIDESLGYPTHDPHGDPIPDANLELPAGSERALADLTEGERAGLPEAITPEGVRNRNSLLVASLSRWATSASTRYPATSTFSRSCPRVDCT